MSRKHPERDFGRAQDAYETDRSMSHSKLSPRLQLLLASVVVIAAVVFAIWRDYTVNTRSEAKSLEQIQTMIQKVNPIGGAVLVDQATSLKTGYTSVTVAYKSTASYEDVKAHYKHELGLLGFKPYREYDLLGSDKKSLYYCKESFDATLDYFTTTSREFNYRLIMSWDNGVLVNRKELCS